eukprot:RCo038802
MAMLAWLRRAQGPGCHGLNVATRGEIEAYVEARLKISAKAQPQSRHRSAVTALALDLAERRYLLSSDSDGMVSCFDTLVEPSKTSGGAGDQSPIFMCLVHEGCVSSVAWYPRDTGLFFTGAVDGRLRVW